MESHDIMIIGYDDESRTFDIADPWQENWGGTHGGLGKLTY